MPGNKIKAVIFDLGETLITFGKLKKHDVFYQGVRSSYDYLKQLGYAKSSFRWYYITTFIHFNFGRLKASLAGRDLDGLGLLKRVGRKKGLDLTDQQWDELTWRWYEPLHKIGKFEQGIKDTIAKLKEAGLKLGILSNTFVHRRALERHLSELGILDFFSVRLYSYEFAFRKPDVRIFKEALEKIGVAAANTIYVGDRIDNDVIPTMKLGMCAVLKAAYSNQGLAVPEGAYKINQIAELPKLIEQINN